MLAANFLSTSRFTSGLAHVVPESFRGTRTICHIQRKRSSQKCRKYHSIVHALHCSGWIKPLTVHPGHDEVDDFRLLFLRELNAERHAPPFVQAATAAGRRRMLREEDGVTLHRGLLAVVRRKRGRETQTDKILRMAPHRLNTLFFDVLAMRLRQTEPSPEGRPIQPCKCFVQRHVCIIASFRCPAVNEVC